MNLPANLNGGVVGEAGAVSIGVLGAASANFLSFPQSMADSGMVCEDAMAASIIRLECQKDELNAEVALLREQARILQAQANELRELLAEIVFWIEGDLRDTVDASYRKAVERAQKLTEGIR